MAVAYVFRSQRFESFPVPNSAAPRGADECYRYFVRTPVVRIGKRWCVPRFGARWAPPGSPSTISGPMRTPIIVSDPESLERAMLSPFCRRDATVIMAIGDAFATASRNTDGEIGDPWQARSPVRLTREDYRAIRENIVAFFLVLSSWSTT
jgi:hypothetical protein